MKKFRCEEMMCDNCVARINKALTEANIEHKVDLGEKMVAIDGGEACESKAAELLEDLGFSPEEVL